MIAPVSVCHQLSWIGRPSACTLHRTASGFRASPTLATKRRCGSRRPPPSAPALISIRTAVGAVYQTVTRSRSRMSYQRSGSNSPSSTMLVTPCTSGATIPYEVPVTQPGSAVHQKTSSGWRSRADAAVAWWATTASCTCTAPFGVPVVPLVKCSSAGASGSVGPISKRSSALAMSAPRSCVPGASSAGPPATSTWRSAGSRSRSPAIFWAWRAVVVTTTAASPSAIRWRSGSGPKAENMGQNTAPALRAPSAATYSSGMRPHAANTRSPGRTPSSRRTFAKRPLSAASSS